MAQGYIFDKLLNRKIEGETDLVNAEQAGQAGLDAVNDVVMEVASVAEDFSQLVSQVDQNSDNKANASEVPHIFQYNTAITSVKLPSTIKTGDMLINNNEEVAIIQNVNKNNSCDVIHLDVGNYKISICYFFYNSEIKQYEYDDEETIIREATKLYKHTMIFSNGANVYIYNSTSVVMNTKDKLEEQFDIMYQGYYESHDEGSGPIVNAEETQITYIDDSLGLRTVNISAFTVQSTSTIPL